VPRQAVEAAAQQLGRHQIIETGNDDGDPQSGRAGKLPFENGHVS